MLRLLARDSSSDRLRLNEIRPLSDYWVWRVIRAKPILLTNSHLGCAEDSAHLQPTACFVSLFFQSSDSMHGVFVCTVTVQRGADAQKKLKGVTEIVAVIAIESDRGDR